MKYLAAPYMPVDLTDPEVAFAGDVTRLMPDPDVIYRDRDVRDAIPGMWVAFQRDWFFRGLAGTDGLVASDGIDKAIALRHLDAVQGSWGPKHEHKEVAVAFLASRWFTDKSRWKANASRYPLSGAPTSSSGSAQRED